MVCSVVPELTESAPCQPFAGVDVEPPTGWSVSKNPGTVPETPPAIAFGWSAGQVAVAVDTPPQTMRLGMTASVALTIDDEAAPLVMPLTALAESEDGPVAYVVDQANKVVHKTAVSVAGIAESGVRIASGLQPGDMVVTAGVQFLRDGMRIRLPGESAQAGAR